MQNLDPCTPILPSACASAVATELQKFSNQF